MNSHQLDSEMFLDDVLLTGCRDAGETRGWEWEMAYWVCLACAAQNGAYTEAFSEGRMGALDQGRSCCWRAF